MFCRVKKMHFKKFSRIFNSRSLNYTYQANIKQKQKFCVVYTSRVTFSHIQAMFKVTQFEITLATFSSC